MEWNSLTASGSWHHHVTCTPLCDSISPLMLHRVLRSLFPLAAAKRVCRCLTPCRRYRQESSISPFSYVPVCFEWSQRPSCAILCYLPMSGRSLLRDFSSSAFPHISKASSPLRSTMSTTYRPLTYNRELLLPKLFSIIIPMDACSFSIFQ